MKETADLLAIVLAAAALRLASVSEDDAAQASAGRWSKKQVLGHLIDSAANNHQRFVRAQLAPSFAGPSYQQEEWVNSQHYASEHWDDLVNFWLHYNRHLVHVIRHVPAAALATPCAIGDSDPVPLSEVISSYVDHMEHHLAQILG